MTDTNHNEEKEALETALNHTAIYRGIQLCTVAITRADDWLAHDDGTVTGPGYTTAVAPSPEVKALIDASLDPAPPIGPPPSPPTPADPPPPPPVDVPPPDDTPDEPPVPPTVGKKQVLTAEPSTVRVGDTFTVTSVFYADGVAWPKMAYALGWDRALVSAPHPYTPTFTALATGVTEITNSYGGTTGRVSVTIIDAGGNAPSDPVKPPADPPADPPHATPPAPLPATPTVPVVPPSKPTATGAHKVEIEVTEPDGSKTWSVRAQVGEDATVDGQYTGVFDGDDIHPGIRARIYSDCCDVGACPGSNSAGYAGTLTVKYDGEVVFGPQAVKFYRGTMNNTLRYGPQAPWHAVDPKLFPNYAKPTAPLPPTRLSKYDTSYNGLGVASEAGMGAQGMRWDIAYAAGIYMRFITQPSDDAYAELRKISDTSDGKWAIYWIDDNTGLPYDITQYPTTSMLPWSQVKWASNPIVDYGVMWATTDAPTAWNCAHQTSYAFIAAAATGTARDKWHAAVHANAVLIAFNSWYRQNTGVWGGYQERATAWSLRSLFLAAHVSCMPDYFAARLDDQRVQGERQVTHPLGFQATYVTRKQKDGSKSTAPWEENFTRLVIGVIALVHPEWRDLQSRMSRWFEIMRKPYWQLATHYTMANQHADGSPLETWDEVITHTLAGVWSDEDIAVVLSPDVTVETMSALIGKYNAKWAGKDGDFDANYLQSPQGYNAIIAAAVAQNLGDGMEWERCISAPTQPYWANGWQWHVVPEAS